MSTNKRPALNTRPSRSCPKSWWGWILCEDRIHNSQFKSGLKRFTATLSSNCVKHNETLRCQLNCVDRPIVSIADNSMARPRKTRFLILFWSSSTAHFSWFAQALRIAHGLQNRTLWTPMTDFQLLISRIKDTQTCLSIVFWGLAFFCPGLSGNSQPVLCPGDRGALVRWCFLSHARHNHTGDDSKLQMSSNEKGALVLWCFGALY